MSDLQSTQADLRHLRFTAYRCFLPDLTGFTGRIAQDQRTTAEQARRVLTLRHYITSPRGLPVRCDRIGAGESEAREDLGEGFGSSTPF